MAKHCLWILSQLAGQELCFSSIIQNLLYWFHSGGLKQLMGKKNLLWGWDSFSPLLLSVQSNRAQFGVRLLLEKNEFAGNQRLAGCNIKLTGSSLHSAVSCNLLTYSSLYLSFTENFIWQFTVCILILIM